MAWDEIDREVAMLLAQRDWGNSMNRRQVADELGLSLHEVQRRTKAMLAAGVLRDCGWTNQGASRAMKLLADGPSWPAEWPNEAAAERKQRDRQHELERQVRDAREALLASALHDPFGVHPQAQAYQSAVLALRREFPADDDARQSEDGDAR